MGGKRSRARSRLPPKLRRGTRAFPRFLRPARPLPDQPVLPRGSDGRAGGRGGGSAAQHSRGDRLPRFARGIFARQREPARGVTRGGKAVGVRSDAGGSFALPRADPRESLLSGGVSS